MENIPTPQGAGSSKKKDVISRQYAFGMVMALAVVVSFVAGISVGGMRSSAAASNAAQVVGNVLHQNGAAPSDVQDVDFNDFWDIWKTVKARHVGSDPADDKKMFYGSIAGMVASLGDPYSVFFNPEYAKQFNDQLGGEFEGIGAEIGIKHNQLTVVAPLPGSPAEKAGIRAGDLIVGIDDKGTVGMSADEAVTLIRGTKGTVVKLYIMREDLKEPKEIDITRAKIVVETVKWKMETVAGKKVAHITISQFNDKTATLFASAARSVLNEDPAGIVLDLRNDPGGYLDAAVAVAGEWVGDSVVVTEKFGDGKQQQYKGTGSGRLGDVPTVVLMNGGSASASEILAGALQDYGKAQLVGEKSFGKGSVQDYQQFGDGSALKLTIALWYTPKDHNINKQGILPDVAIKNLVDDFNADLDPQLDKAYEVLTGTNPHPLTAEQVTARAVKLDEPAESTKH